MNPCKIAFKNVGPNQLAGNYCYHSLILFELSQFSVLEGRLAVRNIFSLNSVSDPWNSFEEDIWPSILVHKLDKEPHLIFCRLAEYTWQCRVYRNLYTEFLESFGICWNMEFLAAADEECLFQQSSQSQLLVLQPSASSPSPTCFLQPDDLLELKQSPVRQNNIVSLQRIKYLGGKNCFQLQQHLIRLTGWRSLCQIIEEKNKEEQDPSLSVLIMVSVLH